MASPFNRKKTTGAFGSNKIKNIGYIYEVLLNEKAEPQQNIPSDPNRPNVANIIIDFSQPILSQAGKNHTAIKGAMNVAILLWNAIVEGEETIAIAKEKLLSLPDASIEQIESLIETMRDRKKLVAEKINFLVRKYDLNFTKHGINFSVSVMPSSKIEGVEKASYLSALKNTPPEAQK